MRRILFLLFILFISGGNLSAQSRSAVEFSTDVAMFVPSVAGAVVAFAEKDYEGLWQLVGSGAASIAAAYALKYTVNKERPDGSDNHSVESFGSGLCRCNIPATALRLEICSSCLYCRGICGVGQGICTPTRCVGCACRGCHRHRMRCAFHHTFCS